jgi:predicted transcriptional regulator
MTDDAQHEPSEVGGQEDPWDDNAWQQRLAAEDAAARGPAPETRTFVSAARRYRALSEPVRLHMLHLLEQGTPKTVGELAALVRLSVSAASRHSAQLEAAGFIERERHAHYVVCRALVRGWAQPEGAAPGAAPEPPIEEAMPGGRPGVASDLRTADPESVRFYISFGMSVLETAFHDAETWKWKMEDWFGPGILPHLDVLAEAIRRVMASESLEGLPLPEVVITEGWDL